MLVIFVPNFNGLNVTICKLKLKVYYLWNFIPGMTYKLRILLSKYDMLGTAVANCLAAGCCYKIGDQVVVAKRNGKVRYGN